MSPEPAEALGKHTRVGKPRSDSKTLVLQHKDKDASERRTLKGCRGMIGKNRERLSVCASLSKKNPSFMH